MNGRLLHNPAILGLLKPSKPFWRPFINTAQLKEGPDSQYVPRPIQGKHCSLRFACLNPVYPPLLCLFLPLRDRETDFGVGPTG